MSDQHLAVGHVHVDARRAARRSRDPRRRRDARAAVRITGGRASAGTSSSARRASLRCVHVVAPRNSARTRPAGRRACRPRGVSRWPRPRGTRTRAAPAASRCALDHVEVAAVDVDARRCTRARSVSVPSSSTWLSRNIASTTSGASSIPGTTSMRRRRRMPCAGSSPGISCHAHGSSADVERRCVRSGDDRRQALGQSLDDGAVGLPSGAQVGLLDAGRALRACAAAASATPAVGPRALRGHRLLRREAGDERGDRAGRRAAGTRGGRRGPGRRRPRSARRGSRSTPIGRAAASSPAIGGVLVMRDDALRVGVVDGRLERAGVEHRRRAVERGAQVATDADEHELAVDAVRSQHVDARRAAHASPRGVPGRGRGRVVRAVPGVEREPGHVRMPSRDRPGPRRTARGRGTRARGRASGTRRGPSLRPP